jgi:hypothetical protein
MRRLYAAIRTSEVNNGYMRDFVMITRDRQGDD